MKAKVAERGQVTIPQKLRKKLGIRPGTILVFEMKGHLIILSKAEEFDPIKKVYGCLGESIHTNKTIDDLRGKS